MTVATALRRTAGTTFDPLTAISWHTAFWASDPLWSNPGDSNEVTSWRDGSGNSRTANVQGTTQPIKYYTSVAALNNQPGVVATGSGTASSTTEKRLVTDAFTNFAVPRSLVVIGYLSNATGTRLFCDGDGTGGFNRAFIYGDGTNWVEFQGGTITSTVGVDTSAHLFVGYANNTGADFLLVGATSGTGNAGNHGITKVSLFGRSDGAYVISGGIAFYGAYAGNVTADGQWSAFKTWANTTYGVTT